MFLVVASAAAVIHSLPSLPAPSSRWPGEIVLAVRLRRGGGGQRRQHPEFPPAAAAARETVFAGKTLQTLEVEEEKDQRQVPGHFQR